MRKSLLTLLAAVALVLVLAASALVFLPKRGPTTHTKSVTIRYAGHDTAAGAAPGELTFWVTNHTSKKLFVVPLTIEVHMPAGWTTYSQVSPLRDLSFSTNAATSAVLKPHAAGLGRIPAQNLDLPTNTAWRVKALVAERLEGVQRAEAIFAIPAWLRYQRSTGKKVDLWGLNPFRRGSVITRGLEHVLSEEVLPP